MKLFKAKPKCYRFMEIKNPIDGSTYWRIEKKGWFGIWYQPSLTYAEGATFNIFEEAERQYNYLIGNTKFEEKIIANSGC